MSYAAHGTCTTLDDIGATTTKAHPGLAARLSGALGRIFERMIEARQRRAEREVAAFLARTGGRLTDSVEREMSEKLFRSGRGLRG